MACLGDVVGTSVCRGNQFIRPLGAAGVFAALALAATAGAQQPVITSQVVLDGPDVPSPIPHYVHNPVERPDFFVLSPDSGAAGPFVPRAPLLLYSRFSAANQGANLWGPGGSPAGSGTQPDIVFDEVNIPVARLVDMTSGLPCTRVAVKRVKISVRSGSGATPAGELKLYWTTFDSRLNPGFLNSTLRTPHDQAPTEPLHEFATLTLAPTATGGMQYFNVGANDGPTLFEVPLHMNTVGIGGVPATLGTFAIGQQIIAPAYSGFTVLLSNTGLTGFDGQPTLGDPNTNTFWYYDSDLCTPERTVGYGGTVTAAFTLEVFGEPIVSATPTACCLPSATTPICFVAANVENCLQSNGIVAAPAQATCTPNPCVQTTCCNPVTGACTTVAVANCVAPLVAAGSACTPINPCTPPTTPANDECSAPVALVLGTPLINESMAGASRSFPEGTAACGFFTQIDRWYSFTTDAMAPNQGIYRIRATPKPTAGLNVQQQLVLKAYSNACPIADQAATLACFDSQCDTGDLTIILGPDTTILICVQVQSTAASTLFDIGVTSPNSRPCCSPANGLCVLSNDAGQCLNPAYPNAGPVNTLCTPNPCPRGACCNGATCTVVGGEPACLALGATRLFLGDGSTCAPSNQCAGSCCDAVGVCTIVPRDAFGNGIGCADQNLFTLGGACNPYPCSNVAAPANDECATVLAGAETVNAATIAATGSVTINSTLYGSTPDLPGASCTDNDNASGGPGRDVWLKFIPAATGSYGFSLCNSPAALDSIMSIYTDCNTEVANTCVDDVGCGSNNRLPAITLTGGTTYLIRVGVWSLNQAPNNFVLQVWLNGACCNTNTGACTTTATAPCGAGTTWQGAASTCTPNPCAATSACCVPAGTCSVLTAVGCAALTGGVANAQATCTPNPCPQPSVCCTGTTCTVVLATTCTTGGGTPQAGTSCTTNPCQPLGVCCRGATCSTSAALQGQAPCALSVTGQAGAKFVVAAACGGPNHQAPCCFADYTQNGTRDVSDIFAYLTDWFATRPWADTDGNTLVQVGDIFGFLTDWFAGGCP